MKVGTRAYTAWAASSRTGQAGTGTLLAMPNMAHPSHRMTELSRRPSARLRKLVSYMGREDPRRLYTRPMDIKPDIKSGWRQAGMVILKLRVVRRSIFPG